MKLTTAIARTLELPSGKDGRIKTDHIVWDDDFPGFGVRLRLNERKNALLASTAISRTWIYQYEYAGRTRRLTIANVFAMGIEDARKIAGQLQSKVRLGDDPMLEKVKKLERAAHTFANVLESFLESKANDSGTHVESNEQFAREMLQAALSDVAPRHHTPRYCQRAHPDCCQGNKIGCQ